MWLDELRVTIFFSFRFDCFPVIEYHRPIIRLLFFYLISFFRISKQNYKQKKWSSTRMHFHKSEIYWQPWTIQRKNDRTILYVRRKAMKRKLLSYQTKSPPVRTFRIWHLLFRIVVVCGTGIAINRTYFKIDLLLIELLQNASVPILQFSFSYFFACPVFVWSKKNHTHKHRMVWQFGLNSSHT